MPSPEQQPDPLPTPADAAPPETPEPRPRGWARVRGFVGSYWTPAGRQALWNLAGLVVCTAISQACSLGVLLILTRGLSTAAFGSVIFAVNLQVYLVILGTFGVAAIVVRDLTLDPQRADETITGFFVIVGVASSATGLLTALVAALVPVSWDERLMLWCVALGNVAACLNLNPFFDATHRQALSAALMLPADVLGLGAFGGLYATGLLTVPSVGFVLLGKWMLTGVLQFVVFRRWVRPLRWSWDGARVRRMIRSGRPILVAGLLYAIPMSGSVVLVRVLGTATAAAVYGLAWQMVAVQIMLVVLTFRVLQPHVTGPYGLTRRFVAQLVVAGGAILGFICAAGLATGWVVIYTFLRPAYHPAYSLLVIFQAFVFCYAVACAVNLYLLRLRRERWLNGVHVVAVICYLGLVFLGGWDSPDGFAWAAVVSAVVLAVGGGGVLWGVSERSDRAAPEEAEDTYAR